MALVVALVTWWSLLVWWSMSSCIQASQEFVEIATPPDEINWRTRLQVVYSCSSSDKMVGISLFVSRTQDKGQFTTNCIKLWRCYSNAEEALSLRKRAVRLPISDDIAFRPSIFNRNVTFVEAAKLVVWIVDKGSWSRNDEYSRLHVHERALIRKAYPVRITPPYSRPYKTFRKSCVPWYWNLMQGISKVSDSSVCPAESHIITLLNYPAAFNGLTYGIPRYVYPFTDPELEAERQQAVLFPKFSIEVWLYILEYCPLAHLNMARACGIFIHISRNGLHLTPSLLINSDGIVQVEVRGPNLYTAHLAAFKIPRHQWVRLLYSFNHNIWTLHWSTAENHTETQITNVQFSVDISYDDTEGQFILGGVDPTLGSFLGYMGLVKLYRGRTLTLEELTVPGANHPMFQLELGKQELKCQQFHQWISNRLTYYAQKYALRRQKYFCSNSYIMLLKEMAENSNLKTCAKRQEAIKPHYRLVARLLRLKAGQEGKLTKEGEIQIAEKLRENVTVSVEEHGFENMGKKLPLLKQASCLGDHNALFTLAVFLNNGIGTTVQEIESMGSLMLGVVHKHRLSALALGHRHMMGIDGVPHDRNVAYMYYKFIGDMTRDDRELHNEQEVATEWVRLIDDKMMEQQTDEKGDLFLWLKHQAQQGVTSAQLQLGQLLFWGSQGLRRNLQAAREFFQQGAERGDPEATYNLGLMNLYGRGGAEKNKTAGTELIRQAAEKRHPFAISAMGWIALEEERNYTKAAALFSEALNLGHMDAGYYLGHMHHHGLYPNKSSDVDTAINYYLWSAVRSHINAGLLYAHLQTRGTETRLHDIRQASEWARFIAEKNAVIGKLLRVGVDAYRVGNIPLAAYHYLLAAEAGPEVASFNIAWLCEENENGVTAMIGKECQWRHYNLSVQREQQFVDSYYNAFFYALEEDVAMVKYEEKSIRTEDVIAAYIKMGDYFWYGCQGKRNLTLAAYYYQEAAKKGDPHALFNLGFMLEEGTDISETVWRSLGIPQSTYTNNITLLMELYDRCRESHKSEAFVPCTLAWYRIWLVDIWMRYHMWMKMSTYLGCIVAALGTIYFVHSYCRHHHQDPELFQL